MIIMIVGCFIFRCLITFSLVETVAVAVIAISKRNVKRQVHERKLKNMQNEAKRALRQAQQQVAKKTRVNIQ